MTNHMQFKTAPLAKLVAKMAKDDGAEITAVIGRTVYYRTSRGQGGDYSDEAKVSSAYRELRNARVS